MAFKELTNWIDDEHCSYRAIKGTDHTNPGNRVAFIEKTPRVNVNLRYMENTQLRRTIKKFSTRDGWAYGWIKSSEEYGKYVPARNWCDNLLYLMGWR
ncbi:hypothetical protein [Bacillus sp. FJAT-22090]|uniref:hypothetical protein n=1 Tax=Bacillus sp. FJAT-22090 TaxID=1581038 RepID=UPI0011A4AFA0|nr:hypothetical protein [Bacillus sp. FJAT-22090]